jgi:phosphatidylserine/phosphatidylglycerophosphate/cardiolipin synthase-like enzyme
LLSSLLLEAIYQAVEALPEPTVVNVVATIEESDGHRSHILARVATPTERAVVSTLLDIWERDGKQPIAVALAAALRSAAFTKVAAERQTSTELVWTGPTAPGVSFRRTDQALQQVIEAAERELLLVTFAAYKVPHILEALKRALQRGVTVRFVAESAEESDGKVSFSAVHALADLVNRLEVYIWPKDKRATDSNGRFGSLHAKCALADDKFLLVSSANLTDHALLLNMEMGLLISGGPLPKQVNQHFRQLRDQGTILHIVGLL